MLTCWSNKGWSNFLSLLQNCKLVGCDKLLFHEQHVAQLCKWNVLLCFHGNSCYVTHIHCLPSLINILHIFPCYFPPVRPKIMPLALWSPLTSIYVHPSEGEIKLYTGSGRNTWRFCKTVLSGTVGVGNLSLSALLARLKAFQLPWSDGL